MKLWLGAAVLLACFALALALLHRESAPPADPAGLPSGWGSVVLGAPSDALPPQAAPPAPAPVPVPVPAPAPAAQEVELVVEPGQSLSAICKAHYGGASVARVEALARYNGLASPDAVRAGQTLKLPPLALLEKP